MVEHKQESNERSVAQSQHHSDNVYNSISRQDREQVLLTHPAAHAQNGHTGDVSFNNPYSQHNGPLGDIVDSLKNDVNALKHADKGSAAYQQAEASLAKDEKSLKQDVFAFRSSADNYDQFASGMQSSHDDLKQVADQLWSMGLKDQASQTTAYFPLEHYKHEFKEYGGWFGQGGSGGGNQPGDGGSGTGGDKGSGGGNTGGDKGSGGNQPGDGSGNQPGDGSGNQPGDGGGNQPGDGSGGFGSGPVPKGAWNFNDLTSDPSKQKQWGDSGAGAIAGTPGQTPDVPVSMKQLGDGTMQLSTGDTHSGNGLWWWKDHNNTAGKSMDWSFDFKFPNGTQNLRCFEADGFKFDHNVAAAPGDANGTRYMAGTQINFDKGGELQLWNDTTNHWVDTGIMVGQFVNKDGGNNHLDLQWHTATGNDGKQYVVYDSYSINGHTFDNSDSQFAAVSKQPASSRPGIESAVGIQHQLDNIGGSNTVIVGNDNFAMN